MSISYSVLEVVVKIWTSRGGIRGSRKVREANRFIVVVEMEKGSRGKVGLVSGVHARS